MPSSKEYLDFVLEQLTGLEGLRARAMMGEYVLYCTGEVIGGVYDDRLLLKPTKSALALLCEEGREAQYELPYPGAKDMLLADIDDGALCRRLCAAVAADLSAAKEKKRGRAGA